MSSNDAPAAPDYSPIANAQIKMAKASNEIAKEQLAWSRKAYAENKVVTDQVVSAFLKTQETTAANAAHDRARYEAIYQPLEDDLAREAAEYGSPERKDLEIGRAQAAVGQNFDAARKGAERQLEGFGISPDAVRYAGLDIGVRAQEAAAKAAASNQTSQMVDATSRALRSEAINVGKGYPGQIAGSYNTALQAGSGANGQNLATTASGANSMGTGVQWNGQAANSYTGAVNTMHTGFTDDMAVSKYNQDAQGQWMALAGAGLGAATKLATGGISPTWGAADGGAVGDMVLAADGGTVPEQVSPSRGLQVDDVPARLNVGEFIMPEEAVRWYGEEKMHKMIVKAREDKAELKKQSGAVPTIHPGAMAGGAPRRQALAVS